MPKLMRQLLAAGIAAMAFHPANAGAWERPKLLGHPATAQCMGDNLCVFVSCPAPGKPSLEMLIAEHGRSTGEEIAIEIDGKKFPLALPERGEHDLYRWPLPPELADAIMKGKRGEVRIDPAGEGWPLPLRGSGAAIRKVMAQCAGADQKQAMQAGGGRLTGLSPETGCETATTTGTVVSRDLNASGKEITAFRFKDKYGVSNINVDPPKNRAAVMQQLLAMIVPGAKLRATVHGCGAAARIEVLSAVEALK